MSGIHNKNNMGVFNDTEQILEENHDRSQSGILMDAGEASELSTQQERQSRIKTDMIELDGQNEQNCVDAKYLETYNTDASQNNFMTTQAQKRTCNLTNMNKTDNHTFNLSNDEISFNQDQSKRMVSTKGATGKFRIKSIVDQQQQSTGDMLVTDQDFLSPNNNTNFGKGQMNAETKTESIWPKNTKMLGSGGDCYNDQTLRKWSGTEGEMFTGKGKVFFQQILIF